MFYPPYLSYIHSKIYKLAAIKYRQEYILFFCVFIQHDTDTFFRILNFYSIFFLIYIYIFVYKHSTDTRISFGKLTYHGQRQLKRKS